MVRLSGAQAHAALQQLAPERPLPAPRMAALRTLRHPQTRALLDSALVLRFNSPNSFTGEASCWPDGVVHLTRYCTHVDVEHDRL